MRGEVNTKAILEQHAEEAEQSAERQRVLRAEAKHEAEQERWHAKWKLLYPGVGFYDFYHDNFNRDDLKEYKKWACYDLPDFADKLIELAKRLTEDERVVLLSILGDRDTPHGRATNYAVEVLRRAIYGRPDCIIDLLDDLKDYRELQQKVVSELLIGLRDSAMPQLARYRDGQEQGTRAIRSALITLSDFEKLADAPKKSTMENWKSADKDEFPTAIVKRGEELDGKKYKCQAFDAQELRAYVMQKRQH